jgi:hypothetical protein
VKKKPLIAVSGHAGVGKDTVADFLVKQYGFVKIALADPLKRICRDVFDFDDGQLWGPSELRNEEDLRFVRQKKGCLGTSDGQPVPKRDIYLTPRYALQTLGTEWGRDCYKDIWIEYGLRVATKLLDGSGTYNAKDGFVEHGPLEENEVAPVVPGVVFSDFRFKNEFEAVKKLNGVLLRIHRKAAEAQEVAGGVASHASEAEQNDVDDDFFDFVVHNDGSKEDLNRTISRICEEILHGKET